MKLQLLNPLYYKPISSTLEELLDTLHKSKSYFDSIVHISFQNDNKTINTQIIAIGVDEEEPVLDTETPKNANELLMLNAGSYIFTQLPLIDKDSIKTAIDDFHKEHNNRELYIRLLKESQFEEVLQLLYPIDNK